MKTLTRDKDGESSIWWHSQCLDKHGRMWRSGRAWLHWPRSSAGVEWSLLRSSCGFSIDCSDTGDDNLTLHLALPFLFSIWLHIARLPIVRRLPGVKWDGKWGSGDREIRIAFHDGALWWKLWRYSNESKSHDWRDSNFDFANFLFGRIEYSESERKIHHALFPVQGVVYAATVGLYTATWKHKRLPWAKAIVCRADIEIEKGIPVPGKGENGFDCEDDAIYSMTTSADTVMEALRALRKLVIRQRLQYGGTEWIPSE